MLEKILKVMLQLLHISTQPCHVLPTIKPKVPCVLCDFLSYTIPIV